MPNAFSFDTTSQLANIVTEIDANEAILALIRGTDVPNIQTNIDDNETKIDSIIALIPQMVRGDLTISSGSISSAAWSDVVNITASQGILVSIFIRNEASRTESNVRLTIDGIVSNDAVLANANTPYCIYQTMPLVQTDNILIAGSATDYYNFMLEFSNSLRVELKGTAGSGWVVGKCLYSLDSF